MGERDRIEVGGEGERLAVRLELPPSQPGGPTLLYLHGLGTDQDGEKAAFFRQSAVAAGHAFASFDFRGHGSSDGEPRRLSVTRNLEDAEAVAAWLCERSHGPLVLIGSSMGGGCGLWLSARRPELFRATITVAPALDFTAGFLAAAGEEGTRRWQQEGSFVFEDGERSLELDWSFVEDGRRYRPAELPDLLCTPSLVFQGRRDDRVDWRGAVRLAEASKQVELHLFGDGDHRLADRKQRLWRMTLEFLRARGFLAG